MKKSSLKICRGCPFKKTLKLSYFSEARVKRYRTYVVIRYGTVFHFFFLEAGVYVFMFVGRRYNKLGNVLGYDYDVGTVGARTFQMKDKLLHDLF